MSTIKERFGNPSSPIEFLIVLTSFIGFLVLVSTITKSLMTGFRIFKRKGKDPKKYGKWAVVTGATDGIGKAYSQIMAQKGMNVLLISRTQSKLDAVQKEIKEAYPNVEVDTLSMDYSKFEKAERKIVADKLKELDLGILVNNVGVSYDHPEYFHALSEQRVQDLITLNVNSTTWMTYIALPIMLEQGRGAIINVSSGAGLYPGPLLSQYSAAKVYIQRFSESLYAEYAEKGIFVQAQTPYFIVSKLSKQRKATFFVPTPEEYVRKAMACLGGDAVENPHIPHGLAAAIFAYVPSSVLSDRFLKMHKGLRKRALRKKERLAAEAQTGDKKNE